MKRLIPLLFILLLIVVIAAVMPTVMTYIINHAFQVIESIAQ